jgi:hypothetical protein
MTSLFHQFFNLTHVQVTRQKLMISKKIQHNTKWKLITTGGYI